MRLSSVLVLLLLQHACAVPTHRDLSHQTLAQTQAHQVDNQPVTLSLPLGAKCFLWLTCVFAIVHIALYVIQGLVVKHKDLISKVPGSAIMEAVIEKAFTPARLQAAKTSLAFTPIVSLLILYLVFRAHTQNIFENDPDYSTLQDGMVCVTIGVIILAVDVLSFRVHSDICGNLSNILGNCLTYGGYVVLLWGMVAVKADSHDVSNAASCFTALAFLMLVVMVLLKVLQVGKEMNPDAKPPPSLELVGELLDTQKMEEIRSASSFASFLMTAFLYLHFHHLSRVEPGKTAKISTVVATVGIFLQAIGVMLRVSWPELVSNIGSLIRTIALIPTYAAFAVLMYCLTWEDASSCAAEATMWLMMAVAIVKALVVFIQEATNTLLEDLDDDNVHDNTSHIQKMMQLFQSMLATTELAEILCILLLFVHFRAELLLGKNPQDYIDDFGYLRCLIWVGVAGVFSQMGLVVASAVAKEETAMATAIKYANSIAIAMTYLSLLSLVVASLD